MIISVNSERRPYEGGWGGKRITGVAVKLPGINMCRSLDIMFFAGTALEREVCFLD
ncbi:hypothetical protein [Desulfallas thermosapovorans]|uniref:hypothetical protein n=1 Tax=Desulfallas thermosapovorans TaxID=58137 RepID=UPI001411B92B|nr:hypothetical protein [Desulfallas thermosapovorans]